MENILAHTSFFEGISDLLSAKPWFKKEKWKSEIKCFPPSGKPEAVSFHIFKSNWFNEERKGIHFETARDLRLGKDKEMTITLHLFHYPIIPGTKIKRQLVAKFLIDRNEKLMRAWDGYDFRSGKYGTQFFSKSVQTDQKNLGKVVAKEFEMLCKSLGDEIDQALKTLLNS